MASKLEIEKYCNRYEELYSCVHALEAGTLADDEIQKLDAQCRDLCVHLNKINSPNTDCKPLQPTERTTFGVLDKEMEEIEQVATKMHISTNELVYFLVCAKLPCYISKVDKALRRSFVEAAVSLYYLERYYLVASISNLFELYSHVDPSSPAPSARDKFILSIVPHLRQNAVVKSIISLLEADVTALSACAYQTVKVVVDEAQMLLRSLLFLFSFSIITPTEFAAVLGFSEKASAQYQTVYRTRKEELFRIDAIATLEAHSHVVVVAALLRQPMVAGGAVWDPSEALRFVRQLKDARESVCSVVLSFVLAVFALRREQLKREDARECRGMLRHCMKRGVFSKLYRDALLLVTHSNDKAYQRILFLLLYELALQYLQVQAAQWHTIVSKQFVLYEQTGKEPSDKADGLETLVYFIQFVLFHLPGLQVTLSGNSVEENILAYFCTMLSDRLRAEPYLFNTYIYLLAAIAGTSSASADAVYEFIEKAPSEHVSWPIMVNALNEAERLLQSEGAQRGLLDPDLTGFIAILTLLANIIRRSTACPTIRSSLQANTIEVCLKLLHQPLHVALKARLCQVLAAIAREACYAELILKQLEYGRILNIDPAVAGIASAMPGVGAAYATGSTGNPDNTTGTAGTTGGVGSVSGACTGGIAWELEAVEAGAQAYPLSTSFLELVLALFRTLGSKRLLRSAVFPAVMRFAIHNVFLRSGERSYLAIRSGERWYAERLCCELMTAAVKMMNEAGEDALVEERAWLVTAELLRGGELLRRLLAIPQLELSHTVLSMKHLLSDCISDASVLVDFGLIDAYPCQVALLRQAMVLLSHLLTVTSETISRVGLRYQAAAASSLVSALASHLLTDSAATVALLLHLADAGEPFLQLLAARILRLLADQLQTSLFLAVFDSFPAEAAAIRHACNDLAVSTLFAARPDAFPPGAAQSDTQFDAQSDMQSDIQSDAQIDASEEVDGSRLRAETCRVLLDLLLAHAAAEFPSVTSTLLALPQSLAAARQENSLQSLLGSCLTFLAYPALVCDHPVLAAKVARLLFLLCSHRESLVLPELCLTLVTRQTLTRLLTAMPFFLARASPQRRTDSLGLYQLVAFALKTLTLVLFHQKRLALALQLLTDEFQDVLEYNDGIRRYFDTSSPKPSTSPLLDALALLDQSYGEPANMPAYLNDCTEGCWVQRAIGATPFVQVDLLKLARSIERLASANGGTYEQCAGVVLEGTAWTRAWNETMEIEATKCFVFEAACDLLHLILIENKEVIARLPRFAAAPCELHVAVLQALLTLMAHSQTAGRSYLHALARLVIDVLALLARTPGAVIPPFTLETLFTQLAQLLLSPHVQQRFDQAACELRSLLYLALLAFLTFVTQRDFQAFLVQPVTAVLPLLVPSLLEDTGLNDLQGRASALALLTLLYESEVGPEVEKLVLAREDVLKCLIRVAEVVDMPVLADDAVGRQQREVVLRTVALLTVIASSSTGALALLDLSLFHTLAHCPLLLLGNPPNYAVYPGKLAPSQRNALRLLLRGAFRLVLTVVESVGRFRSLREELLMVVRSTVNVSLVILEDREPDAMLAREVFALYEAVCMLVVDEKGEVPDDLKGLRQAICSKMEEWRKWKEEQTQKKDN